MPPALKLHSSLCSHETFASLVHAVSIPDAPMRATAIPRGQEGHGCDADEDADLLMQNPFAGWWAKQSSLEAATQRELFASESNNPSSRLRGGARDKRELDDACDEQRCAARGDCYANRAPRVSAVRKTLVVRLA